MTSPPFFGNRTAEREAGVLEALARLPAGERPPYLITSVSAQEKYPSMRELEDGPPIFRSSSFGDEIEIYRTRFDLLGRNARFYLPETAAAVQGLQEVDRLNVCDSRDEADHGYAFRSGLGGQRLFGAPRVAAYAAGERVADAGRLIIGEESFLVRTPARRDLLIVMRTADSATAGVMRATGSGQLPMEIAEAGIVLRVDGKPVGRVTFHPRAGWDEQVFRITADRVADGHTRVQLSGRYASFYYWFFQ